MHKVIMIAPVYFRLVLCEDEVIWSVPFLLMNKTSGLVSLGAASGFFEQCTLSSYLTES